MQPQFTSAVVADTQELFGGAIKGLLEQELGFGEVFAVTNFEAATTILANNPFVTFAAVDITLAGIDGVAGLANLRIAYPELRVAVLAPTARRDSILRALSAGIHGYIPKTLSTPAIVRAMKLIAAGEIYVPPTLSDVTDTALADPFLQAAAPFHVAASDSADDNRPLPLTSRQVEVMRLIAAGHSNKQIARALGVAEGTIKAHVNAIFRALSVHKRASVAAILAAHSGAPN